MRMEYVLAVGIALAVASLLWTLFALRPAGELSGPINPATMSNKQLRKQHERDIAWLMRHSKLSYEARNASYLTRITEKHRANTRLVAVEMHRRRTDRP